MSTEYIRNTESFLEVDNNRVRLELLKLRTAIEIYLANLPQSTKSGEAVCFPKEVYQIMPIGFVNSLGQLFFDSNCGAIFSSLGYYLCNLSLYQSRMFDKLVRTPGQVVSYKELQHTIWPDEFSEFSVLDECRRNNVLYRLRRNLNRLSPELAKSLETVREQGVRWSFRFYR